MAYLRKRALVPLALALASFGWAAWPWFPFSRASAPPRTIVFYGFSILGEVFNEAIFPTFEALWREKSGEEVEVLGSFASSGTITNQVILGVPADLVLVSLELDALRLSEAGVVAAGSWRALPHRGVVNRTPFVILVRPGNPKRIGGFEDLARSGVGVVHPDPLTSGGANWAIVAEYGAGLREYPDRPDAGFMMLRGVWKNVIAQAASARAARTQFENGFGDALVTYEQEALWDRARGKLEADVVYPRRTVLSEHTLAVVDRNVEPAERPIVEAFARFLWSDEAQRLFVRYGFRSVVDEWNAANTAFGRVEDPFTIEDLGGWERAKREIVDGIWKARVLRELK
ncbi:MAG TPA: substrate-binding domain-containing protein [Thermoanaerobaculia bacterium]|nr:substrate-binding domain-containing protein [Thermoanaerobaculia bacterium]